METTNPPDKEFKIMVITMFTGLEKKVDELIENFNKDIENKKKDQSGLKNTKNKKYTRENKQIR